MAAIVTNKFRIYAAQKFIAGIGDNLTDNNVYFFIGKTSPWDDEDAPDFPKDTVLSHINDWSEIFHLKRLSISNCSLVIPRYDWKMGVVYQPYDDSIDLFDPTLGLKPFYVFTSDLGVYKCLSNNYGGPSFVQPTGTSTNIITTVDKYQWKFMFTVGSADAQKFLTDFWIPVKALIVSDGSKQFDVQQSAVDGSIDVILIENGGYGYNTPPDITITGNGSNATVEATIKNGVITSLQITDRGASYTNAVVTAQEGEVTSVIITNGGSGYNSAPGVIFSGGSGSGAKATATILNGVVTLVTVTDGGSEYVDIPTVSFDFGTATATCVISGGSELRAVIPPPNGHGSDAVSELGGYFVLMDVQFAYNEGGFNVTNDFRKIGIVLNPKLYGSSVIASATTHIQTHSLCLTEHSGDPFETDEVIIGASSSAIGDVLDFDNDTNILRLVNVIGTFMPDEIIENESDSKTGKVEIFNGTALGGNSDQIILSLSDPAGVNEYAGYSIRIVDGTGEGQQRRIVSNSVVSGDKVAIVHPDWDIIPDNTSVYSVGNIVFPDLQPNSGYILYVENRRAITRASDQLEDIKCIIEM